MLSSILLAALVPQGVPGSVVINEFMYDNSGADDFEFVELYNTTNAPIDITNWGLDHEHTGIPTGTPPFGAFDITIATMPPSTIVLAPGAHFLIGDFLSLSSVDPMVTSVDLQVGNPGGEGRWWNSHGAIALKDTMGNIIDAVGYEVNKRGSAASDPPLSFIEGGGIWGNQLSRNTPANFRSWARLWDGYDTESNGRDFSMTKATPGYSNNLTKDPTGTLFFPAFTAMSGDIDDRWAAYFSSAEVIDPVFPALMQPSAVADPLPNLGFPPLALTLYDVPGGESATLLSEPSTDWRFEAMVLIDVRDKDPMGLTSASELEGWSICLQGDADWLYNVADPANTVVASDGVNGNTGVGLVFLNVEGTAVLYLVDHNDGGWSFDSSHTPPTPEVILGSVDMNAHLAAMAPPNPLPMNYDPEQRWVRLHMHVTETTVEAHIGGTYGTCNAMAATDPTQHILAGEITQGGPGRVGIGYRENILANGGMFGDLRPPTFHAMTLRYGTDAMGNVLSAGTCRTGVAVNGPNGRSVISVDRMPYLNACEPANITFTNLPTAVGSATTMSFGFGIWNGGAGFDLQPFGGPPDLSLDVVEAAALPVTADVMGSGSVGIGFVSTDPIFIGQSAFAQAFSLEPALIGTYTIPVTDTQVIEFKLQLF